MRGGLGTVALILYPFVMATAALLLKCFVWEPWQQWKADRRGREQMRRAARRHEGEEGKVLPWRHGDGVKHGG